MILKFRQIAFKSNKYYLVHDPYKWWALVKCVKTIEKHLIICLLHWTKFAGKENKDALIIPRIMIQIHFLFIKDGIKSSPHN